MSQPASTAAAAASRHAHRIVLFGMPDAGKSSLLGALAQSAQTQEEALGGKLIDKASALAVLQRRLYEDRPKETLEEIVPIPVELEPRLAKGATAEPPAAAVLFDCDGRVARKIMSGNGTESSALANGSLAKSVLGADTLILAVDASADQAHLNRDFAQFGHFLSMFQLQRGRRAEVGGLPVFLVLTKCDLLAQPRDTTAAWQNRIAQRQREVRQHFDAYFSKTRTKEQRPFGGIDLRLRATAIKHPALANAPARPREPFGVAELFRDCFESARDYRERQRRAAARLGWALVGLAAFIGFAGLLAAFFVASQMQTELGQFEKELRTRNPSASDPALERLREPVKKTIADLEAFRDHPLFTKMPPDLQKQLVDQLAEAEAYEKLSTAFFDAGKKAGLPQAPRFARNAAELDSYRQLLAKFPLPKQHLAEWEFTDLARRQRLWKQEIEIVETEVEKAVRTFADLDKLDHKIKDIDNFTGRQLKEFRDQLVVKDRILPYRFDNHEPVQNSSVTYANIAQFEPIAILLGRYEKVREYHKLGPAK